MRILSKNTICRTIQNRRGMIAYSVIPQLVLCTVGVWLIQTAGEIRACSVAVQAIERCGGAVTYDYQWTSAKAWIPDAEPTGPKWARRAFGENFAANVVEVQLFSGPNQHPEEFTDDQARYLASLTKVQWLVLTDTSITDSGLKHLEGLNRLERLDLERTKVTEAGIQKIHQSLPKVKIYFDDGMVGPE